MLTPDQILLALVALMVKHFICDFVLQFPFHYQNKGTYGHIGGISHASIQALGTFCALYWWTDKPGAFDLAGPHAEIVVVTVFDLVIHYHVDWAKMQINRRMHWVPLVDTHYWWLFGFDQLLHMLTYIAMVWYIKTP